MISRAEAAGIVVALSVRVKDPVPCETERRSIGYRDSSCCGTSARTVVKLPDLARLGAVHPLIGDRADPP